MNRVRLLSAGRLGALALFVVISAALAGYLFLKQKRTATDTAPRKLQGRVVAVFSNTRYQHDVEGKPRFVLTSGIDRSYQDGTHELEQVRLESYGITGLRHDVVTADRAKVSDPADLNRLDAEFIANVVVQTSDDLTVKTSYFHYKHASNTVETTEVVEFEGHNFTGRSTGALIEAADERAHLLKDVEVTIKPKDDAAGSTSVAAAPGAASRKTSESAEERAARKARKRARRLERRQAEGALAKGEGDAGLDNRSSRKSGSSNSARPAAPELASKKPTHITSASAVIERKDHRVTFDGGVVVTQGADEMRAARMTAYTDATNHLERVEARANSQLKQADRAEIASPDMDFFFGDSHQLASAVATGGAYVRSLGAPPLREARASTIEATFVEGQRGSVLDTIKASGGAVLQVHPLTTDTPKNPAERELTASVVTLHFYPDGRNISAAEAADNAVLTVTPIRADPRANKKTIRAPRMNASFYEEGNRLKSFNATGGVKVEMEPMVPGKRLPRVTTSKVLVADFLPDTQDLERVTQEGDFKYTEGDRHGVAERASYDGQREWLSLRGRRPQVWDDKARTQADEIDYDQQKDEMHARGDVRTTYYSREKTGDSTPFKNTKSPIFMTAERADARNEDSVAIYTINARGWQDDSFVKADRIELYQDDSRMVAIGNVDTALYQVKRETTPGARETVPGFASSERMTYSDTDRKARYEGNVKARQGTDRIDASIVDVYLRQETNEVDRMTADGNVVLTQPGRRGTGDHLTYSSDDGRAVLSGKTARVDDTEKGSTMGSQLTLYTRDDKIAVENQQGAGRVRTSHRLTKSKK